MAEFTPDISADLIVAIRDASEDIAGALARGLDGEFNVEVGEKLDIDAAFPEDWNGGGLLVALRIGDTGALLWLPESSGLVPDWCAKPDLPGTSKLATLAQELGIVLLPEAFAPTETDARFVFSWSDAFGNKERDDAIASIPIQLTTGDKVGTGHFIWPVADPLSMLSNGSDASDESESAETDNVTDEQVSQTQAEPETSTATPPAQPIQYADLDDGIRQLPTYAKSLLKVKVPVTVTLATTKHSVEDILALGPGSILQFDKRCEDNLQLEIGDQQVAEGEAVKVGDKFGLWITSMTMPDERFWIANGKRAGKRVQ